MESELDTLVLKKRRARLLNPQTAPESFLVSTMFQYMPPQPIPQYNPPQPQQPMEEDYDRRRESLASEVSDIKKNLLRAMDAQHLHENKHSERIDAAAARGESARASVVTKARGENVKQAREPQPEEQLKKEERHDQKARDARVERDTSRRSSARSSSVMRSRASVTHGQNDRAYPADTPPLQHRTRTRSETKMSGATDAEKSEMLRELLTKDDSEGMKVEHHKDRADSYVARSRNGRASSVTRTRGM
jgi:hypothetical protein